MFKNWFHRQNKADFTTDPLPNTRPLLAEFGRRYSMSNYTLPNEEKGIDKAPIFLRQGTRGQILTALSRVSEISTAINYWCDAAISSEDGDDRGIAVADTIDRKNQIPIEKEIEEIATETIERLFTETQLRQIARGVLVNGCHFRHARIEGDTITRLIELPTWQTFRFENEETHEVEAFFLKKDLMADTGIKYDPLNTFHWRFRPLGRYGEALFEHSESDAETLLKRLSDLDFAARAQSIDPLVHEMPPCADEEYTEVYKKRYLGELKTRLITDFFVAPGQKIYRASGGNTPDLTAIISCMKVSQMRLVMVAQVPHYLVGVDTKDGGQEISGQPATAFSRATQTLRATLTEQIRAVIKLQLTLRGIPEERQRFRIIYPKIILNPYGLSESKNINVDDESPNIVDTEK